MLEDRLDVRYERAPAASARAHAASRRSGPCCFASRRSAQAGAIALLGMRPALENRAATSASVWRADGRAPSESGARGSIPDARGAPSACAPGWSCSRRAA